MADTSVHDWSEGALPDSGEVSAQISMISELTVMADEHRRLLQDGSSANLQEPTQTATKMVSWLHHERSVHAYRHSCVEALSATCHYPTCSEHYPHYGE